MNLIFRLLLVSLTPLLAAPARAQAPPAGRFTISGYVRDAASGESLPGVAVVHPASGEGTTTNTYGFYSLTLSAPAAASAMTSA